MKQTLAYNIKIEYTGASQDTKDKINFDLYELLQNNEFKVKRLMSNDMYILGDVSSTVEAKKKLVDLLRQYQLYINYKL